ncbi:MAG TPA: hypothetical protein VEG38_02965 [Acidimicrobiia bacterium]|nr:hypothetical protein [Acidimicrobiia bacterium]
MAKDTPIPDEEKVKVDPQSGEIEPAPIDMEGARIMANEASEDLDGEMPLDKQDVRRAAEEYVTERGADDTDNFEARLKEGAPPEA